MVSPGQGDKRVNIRDVAARAHVHASTVSRALRDDPRVRPETKAAVLAAANELGFVPDRAARLFRDNAKRRPMVAVLVDVEMFTGTTRNAQAYWFFMTLELTKRLAEFEVLAVQSSLDAPELVESAPIDLVVDLSIRATDVSMSPGLETVGVVADRGRPESPAVVAQIGHDHPAIAQAVCHRLVELGSRKVAFLPLSRFDCVSPRAAAGYIAWCDAVGQEPVTLNCDSPELVIESVSAAVCAGVDGIYALSAQMTQVLDGVKAAGRRIPEDVQVIGVGNDFIEPFFDPPLSAVNLEGAACGDVVAHLVRRQLAGADFEIAEFPWRLMERSTTR